MALRLPPEMSLDQLDVMRKCDQLADLIVGPKEDFEAHLLACGEDWLLSSDIIDRALGESGLLALTSDECTALARSSSALTGILKLLKERRLSLLLTRASNLLNLK
jgi:hypothetical protein